MKQRMLPVVLLAVMICVSGCDISVLETGQEKSSRVEYDNNAGEPYEVLQDNAPEFTDKEKKSTKAFERYSSLDSLGRCGVAFANICKEIMPTGKRGEISQVKPSGWHTVKYDTVDGKYLYNRCHLIGYQLAGENANERNLITGTRYLNVEGMLPFEDKVADYVKETGNHVLYRVTPEYEDDELVARGVQMEGYSVEDQGEGICFNVFVYNVQPGIAIDYATGDSEQSDDTGDASVNQQSGEQQQSDAGEGSNQAAEEDATKQEYVINKNTKKFHEPSCSSVKDTLAKNRKTVTESRDRLLEQGYEPCGKCKP
ncbi:MAG: DNA/RNA non-specific endonuclease [Eubacteriales bacterium]|nr:DNA/RNA non-specific endonuclease [Eubacteriales bacterium]